MPPLKMGNLPVRCEMHAVFVCGLVMVAVAAVVVVVVAAVAGLLGSGSNSGRSHR